MRRIWCRFWHGPLVAMSDAFEWCTVCDRDYWRGRRYDGVTTPDEAVRRG